MVKEMLLIIERNIKIMLNSKMSSAIILLAPLLLIGIMGLALQDTSLKNVKVSIYGPEKDSFYYDFVTQLNDKSFKSDDSNSIEECKDNVINSKSQACIELIKKGEDDYQIKLFVDFSQQRIVWNIIGTIQGVVEEKSRALQEDSISQLNKKLENVPALIKENKEKIDSALFKIEILEDKLGDSERDIFSLLGYLENINQTIGEMRMDVDELSAQGVDVSSLQFQITNIEKRIEDLRTEIKSAEKNIIDSSDIQIKRIKDDLLESREDLEDMEEEFRRAKELDLNKIVDPIPLNYFHVSNEEEGTIVKDLRFIDYLIPSFFMFFILFSSIILSSVFILRERKSMAYLRNRISSVSQAKFISGNFLTIFLTIFLQIALVIFISGFFTNIKIISNLGSIIIICFISIFLFGLMGVAIGSIFSSNEGVLASSISISLLLVMFMPIITPLETIHPSLIKIVSMSPLVFLETKLRLATIFDIGFAISITEIIILSLVSLFLLGIISYSTFKFKEKEI